MIDFGANDIVGSGCVQSAVCTMSKMALSLILSYVSSLCLVWMSCRQRQSCWTLAVLTPWHIDDKSQSFMTMEVVLLTRSVTSLRASQQSRCAPQSFCLAPPVPYQR